MKHKQRTLWGYPYQFPWPQTLANPFRLDLRALATMRIGLGLIIFYDSLARLSDLVAHYTDQGVLLASDAAVRTSFSFNLHATFDGWWWPAALLIAQALVAIAFIIGWHTKVATILLWISLVSLQNRNPVLLNAGDIMLRVYMFWVIFLPLADKFSLDAVQNRITRTAKTAFNPATVAIVLQTFIIYFQTAALKTGAAWRESYEALYYTLSAEQFSSPIGVWLTQFRETSKVFTFLAIRVEDLAPLLLVSPLLNIWTRTIGVLMIIGLQLGIVFMMSIGIFPWIAIVIVVGLIPSPAWDWLTILLERVRPARGRLTVFFDPDCGICQAFVRFNKIFMVAKGIEYKSLYDYPAILKKSDEYKSWVGRSDGKHFYRAEVFFEIIRRSILWWWLVPLLRFKPIAWLADKIYRSISQRRHQVCLPKQQGSRLKNYYRKAQQLVRYAGFAVVIFTLGITLVWTYSDLPNANGSSVNGKHRSYYRYLRMDQLWDMFAPFPITRNSWYEVKGQTVSGGEVDVWREYVDGPGHYQLESEPPNNVYNQYVNQRWRRYLTRIQEDGYARDRQSFLNYMCRDWHNRHPDIQLSYIELTLYNQKTLLNQSSETTKAELQSTYECADMLTSDY